MHIDDFNFFLPEDLIAQSPVFPRDSARMLYVSSEGRTNLHISNLPDFLREGDVIVANNTKVIPARLFGKRGAAGIEVMLHKHVVDTTWDVFAKPAKKLRIGDTFTVSDDFYAEVMGKHEDGTVRLCFNGTEKGVWEHIHQKGIMPLPPYIKRDREGRESDQENYQTLFAEAEGAVAAPTAGLHFTPELIEAITARAVELCYVTLHVGAGTFQPVKVDHIADHKMHAEYAVISPEVVMKINHAKKRGNRVIAIGTTSLRTLESAVDEQGYLKELSGETRLFITPGYQIKIVDMLVTNFHLPKSTLFMLVSAFSGFERMKEAYAHAIEQKYRFYSYGDACLLERDEV